MLMKLVTCHIIGMITIARTHSFHPFIIKPTMVFTTYKSIGCNLILRMY